MVSYISPVAAFSTVYNVLPESQQAVSVQRNSQRRRERKGKCQSCSVVSGSTSPHR
ncbi:hypothetical protein PAMP_009179 [Pampus punctatissimus]